MIAEAEETTSDVLLRLLPATAQPESEKLPTFTTAADIRELVQYLKRKPAGVIAAEELSRPRKRLFDDRKLDAYEFLGITTHQNQTLKLTSLGWKFAQSLEKGAEVFRFLLEQHGPYAAALEWVSQENIDMITSTELSAFWQRTNVEAFAVYDAEAVRGGIVSFFSICQAAGLGTMTLGKRGHITRLLVDRDELAKFLNERSGSDFFGRNLSLSDRCDLFEEPKIIADSSVQSPSLTVLIRCDVPAIAELLQQTLDIAGLPNQLLADRNGNDSTQTFPRGHFALIVVLGEQSFLPDANSSRVIQNRILWELGAAHVLYDGRIILLADRTATHGEGLKDLITYEFDNDRLDWKTGLQLIKHLAEFSERINHMENNLAVDHPRACQFC